MGRGPGYGRERRPTCDRGRRGTGPGRPRPWSVGPAGRCPGGGVQPAGTTKRSRPRTLLRARRRAGPATASATDAGSWSGATTRLRRASTPAPGPIQAAATPGLVAEPRAAPGPGSSSAYAGTVGAGRSRARISRSPRTTGTGPARSSTRSCAPSSRATAAAAAPRPAPAGPRVPPGQRRDAGEHGHRPPAPAVVQQHQGDVGLPCRSRARLRPARSGRHGCDGGQHPGPCSAASTSGRRPRSAATASSAAASAASAPRCHPRTRVRDAAGRLRHGVRTGRRPCRRQGSTMAMTGPPPDRPWWTAATDTKTAGSPVTDATTPPTHDLICRCQCTSSRRA